MTSNDPFDLQRFVDAQAGDYATALSELQRGRKRSHWIWYVLPQLRGLGLSAHSQRYGIASLAEARAYLAHPILGARLNECVAAIARHKGTDIAAILGSLDAMKYQSCLTLFNAAAGENSPFVQALQDFFGGREDARTKAMLESARDDPREPARIP
jgi:uncharacterized protein (DUF1810 family)